MRWETSAGGLVLRETRGKVELAVIRPRRKSIWALPKGHVDPGETPEQTALREVLEETGLVTAIDREVGSTKYEYTLHGQRICKTVHFYLLHYVSGEVGRIDPAMRVEVSDARWIALAQSARLLTYRGEREMALRVLSWRHRENFALAASGK